MAGIGFELKKLFRRKGMLAGLRAYGYAGIICTGPMLLGVLLQGGLLLLCGWAGAPRAARDLLVCMVTYTLLASLTVTSFFSMPVTRFVADQLYEERAERVLPSFAGACAVQLALGCVGYGAFLLASGATFCQGLLCLWLFAELVVCWTAMSYLTALKEYRGILIAFAAAVGAAFGAGWVLVFWLGVPVVEGFLAATALGYGVMLGLDVRLLCRFFPEREGSPWRFLRWVKRYRTLALTGLLLDLGLFAHLVIVWLGPLGVQVKGLFYGAPYYDVPALLAFLSILTTTVNFVVSVEVQFYPRYRTYYSLFNDGGVVGDIKAAEEEMLAVLNRELYYTALKQLFTTAAVISLETLVLGYLPLGFNDLMHGCLRTLCAGYGLYAVGNTVLLILLYFTDYKGALGAAAARRFRSGSTQRFMALAFWPGRRCCFWPRCCGWTGSPGTCPTAFWASSPSRLRRKRTRRLEKCKNGNSPAARCCCWGPRWRGGAPGAACSRRRKRRLPMDFPLPRQNRWKKRRTPASICGITTRCTPSTTTAAW